MAEQDVRCGKARPLWWQGTREAAFGRLHKGGRPPSAAAPFVVPLFLATTEVLSCHNEHPVLPQRTSRLATQEIRRIASQRRMDVPMFFGHNSTLAAPLGASVDGIDIIIQRASFWIGPMYLV